MYLIQFKPTNLIQLYYLQCVQVNFSVYYFFFVTIAYDDGKHLDLPTIEVLQGIKFPIHGIYYSGGLWNSTNIKNSQ